MKSIKLLIQRLNWLIVLVSLLPAGAAAEKTAPSPLGFTVGQAALAEVKKGLAKKAEVLDAGLNHYTHGQMLEVKGEGLGMRRLKRARFVFDKDKRLVAVLMHLHKGAMQTGFDETYAHLAAKYQLVSKQVPFVGNREARFRQGDVSIILESPHLGFEMSLVYMTRAFETQFRSRSKADTRQEKSRERSNF